MILQGLQKNILKIETIKLFATFLSKEILERCGFIVQNETLYELLMMFHEGKKVSKKCYIVNLCKYLPVRKKKTL